MFYKNKNIQNKLYILLFGIDSFAIIRVQSNFKSLNFRNIAFANSAVENNVKGCLKILNTKCPFCQRWKTCRLEICLRIYNSTLLIYKKPYSSLLTS